MTFDEITVLFQGKSTGQGKFQARCPSHDDSTASLTISNSAGKVLMHCHAGCKTADVMLALGLKESDLFETSLAKKAEVRETLPADRWPCEATYVYQNALGEDVYRVRKLRSPDSGKKTFRQESKQAWGWQPSMTGVQRVLYNLPALADATCVYVVEGEKDVESLRKVGVTATTNVAGAGKWTEPSYAEALRGKDVVILPDNDDPGRAHAQQVSHALRGIAASAMVVELPNLPAKGDVSDWIAAGGTAVALDSLVAAFVEAPRMLPAKTAFVASSERLSGEREGRILNGQNRLTFGVQYLDDALGGILRNDLVLLGARSGTGKTQLATITALANCSAGKRVHYFALEAEPLEIERRIKFQILARNYYANGGHTRIRYQDWHSGLLDASLGDLEPAADAELAIILRGLRTFYREKKFTSGDFQKHLSEVQAESDLIILDHLHYVDNADENENRGYKKTVQQIRDSALDSGKPVIVVAHVRKGDRRFECLVPGLEDFHGSSDIGKIATKAIMLAPDREFESGSTTLWSTFMTVVKCRTDSSLTRYCARLMFDAQKDIYRDGYKLGRLTSGDTIFEELNVTAWPSWYKPSYTED